MSTIWHRPGQLFIVYDVAPHIHHALWTKTQNIRDHSEGMGIMMISFTNSVIPFPFYAQ